MLPHNPVSRSTSAKGSSVMLRQKRRSASILVGRSSWAAPGAVARNTGPMWSNRSSSVTAPPTRLIAEMSPAP